jgi:hypothetical protein
MASGTPAVVSSHPSMDEASGDAAVRVDPRSTEAIAAGIEQALAQREALVPQGLEHAAQARSAVHVASLRRGDLARVRERPWLSSGPFAWASCECYVPLAPWGRGDRHLVEVDGQRGARRVAVPIVKERHLLCVDR